MGIVGQIWYENGDSPKIVKVLPPLAVFFDDFNRTDQPLETSANWFIQTGSASAINVFNNAINFSGSGKINPTIYVAPDPGVANHFVEVTINTVASLTGMNAAVRLTPTGDYVAFRERGATGYQIYQNVGGTLTLLGTAGTIQVGDVMRLVAIGDQVILYKNGAPILGPVTTTVLTGTRQGMVVRGDSVQNIHDNWRSGAGTGA